MPNVLLTVICCLVSSMDSPLPLIHTSLKIATMKGNKTNKPLRQTKKRGGSCLQKFLKLVVLLVLVAGCGLMYLRTNCCARQRLFAKILATRDVTKMSEFSKEVVCPAIAKGYDDANASSGAPITVVDVGTGAGASIICHAQQMHRIKKLYIIEPNPEFTSELERVVAHFGFPAGMVEIVAEGGEDASKTVETGSADLVTTSHLLCSVDADTLSKVTSTISRMLRSGGVYVGVDHTKTRLDATPSEIPGPVPVFPFSNPTVMRVLQTIVEPFWETIANGCKFVDMPELYKTHFSKDNGFDANSPSLREFRYPVMTFMPLVWDHIIGTSRKI